MRILATADWQLDMLGGTLSPTAREHLAETRVSTVEKILELAAEENVDAILAAGDLFEYPSPSPAVITEVAAVIQRHRNIPIHAIPGNHDLYGYGTVWKSPEFEAIGHFHLHSEQTCVELSDGFYLHSIPVKNKFATDPQEELLDDVSDKDGVHIVMAHGHDVSYMNFGDHESDDCNLPIDSNEVIAKGYALVILGHWHSWNEVAPRVLYPGTHEQTKFTERDAGYVAIIDIPEDGGDPVIDKKKIGQIQWSTKTFDCTGRNLPDELIDYGGDISNDTDFLKLALTGEVELDDFTDAIPRAQQACEPMFGHLIFETQDLTTSIDVVAMTNRVDLPPGLREIQGSILLELKSAQGDDEATKDLQDELRALYRACRDAGVLN